MWQIILPNSRHRPIFRVLFSLLPRLTLWLSQLERCLSQLPFRRREIFGWCLRPFVFQWNPRLTFFSKLRSFALEALDLDSLSNWDKAIRRDLSYSRLMQNWSASTLILSHFMDGTTELQNVDELSEEGYQQFLVTIASIGKIT